MIEGYDIDKIIRAELINLFVKKDELRDRIKEECKLKNNDGSTALNDTEIAALSCCCEGVGKAYSGLDGSFIFDENAARNVALEVFGKINDDNVVNTSYNMTSANVKSTIGYSVEFEDFGINEAAYQANSELLDRLYAHVRAKASEMARGGR